MKSANRLIKSFDDDYPNTVRAYLKKWGMK